MVTAQSIDQLIQHLTNQLGLVYLAAGDTVGGVCYANDATLRPEFRQSFTLQHVQSYLHAIERELQLLEQYKGQLKTSNAGLIYPLNTDVFWEIVDLK